MENTNSNSNSNANLANCTKPSRLDLEVYIMGDMKLEFMSFLSDCFKENFFETLSWGNIRRFQLVLSSNKIWINIYFIFLRNETNSDILIYSFKIYEKRNLLLLFYNANDPKSEKQNDALYDSLILERNKLYEGILNEENINQNLKKITTDSQSQMKYYTHNEIKNNLKFLTDISSEDNLIFKIGFCPNTINKKTKNIKKSDSNVSYDVKNDIFYISEKEESCDFFFLMNFVIEENFKKLKMNSLIDTTPYFDFLKSYALEAQNGVQDKKPNKKIMHYFVKAINFLILPYIIASLYKFIIEQN